MHALGDRQVLVEASDVPADRWHGVFRIKDVHHWVRAVARRIRAEQARAVKIVRRVDGARERPLALGAPSAAMVEASVRVTPPVAPAHHENTNWRVVFGAV